MKDFKPLPWGWLSTIATSAERNLGRVRTKLEAQLVRVRNRRFAQGDIPVRWSSKTTRGGARPLLRAIWALLVALSVLDTVYLFLIASLSMTPGEVLNPDDPMSAPFTVTNTSQFWSFMNVSLDCQVNRVRIKGHPEYHLFDNDYRGYEATIPELGPDGQDTVYCAGDRRSVDLGPIEFSDVTITFLYEFPFNLPCHGMKWKRYKTVLSSDGKLSWVPIGIKDAPVPTEMVLRLHFYCGPLLWYSAWL